MEHIKAYGNQKLFSKDMPAIAPGVLEEMLEDFQTMYMVEVVNHLTENEELRLVGDIYRDINKFGNEIREDPNLFRKAFYDKSMGQVKSNILNNLPPVVDYTITFTIDIETQAPGFCGPSSASLQVIVAKSWIGNTAEKKAFNKRQMCMSLRFAPPTTSFLIDLCYDLPDCKGK